VAGSLLDIPQRDAALAWARELISRLDEGQTRQALASTLESVDRVLMAGPGSLPYSERRATLDQFLKELTSGERVITAIAELREWCGHLSPSHRDTAARRLATLEEYLRKQKITTRGLIGYLRPSLRLVTNLRSGTP
jgi:hypothetical protein